MRIEPLDEIESAIKPWFQVTMPLFLPSLCTFAFVIEDALEDMRCFVLMLLGALMLLPSAQAQNVTGYGSMPDPTLFLLREPAIHQALRLSDQQRRELIAFNDRYDETLLSTRNKPADEAQPKLNQVFQKTIEHVVASFNAAQQQRLRQIMYRIRGISFVLLPSAKSKLELTDEQIETIDAAVKESLKKVSEAQTPTFQGKEAFEESQRKMMAARKEEYETILGVLSATQKRTLNEMVGSNFDTSVLGRVSFKAPDLSGGTEWINSTPLTLEDLRGKVVALHFWAFG